LLLRQLKRAGIDVSSEPSRDLHWNELLRQVARTYRDDEESRYLLERSLELSSREMNVLNARLAAERERLEGEFEIARNLQTSILPRDVHTASYEAVASVVPATEVGGDYYDVIAVDGGCWIAIGDVAGHGLRAAVVMTMVQSMVAVLVRQTPHASPRDIVIALNRAVHDNVFKRLDLHDHVTLSLFRCRDDGEVTFAGAHEPALVHRAETGACEKIETPETWLGPIADISQATSDRTFRLSPGDLLALHTDGVTEARNAGHEQYGFDRLVALVRESHARPGAEICARTISAVREWTGGPNDDDLTVLVYRRLAG